MISYPPGSGRRVTMRGRTDPQAKMLFGVTAEDFVPANHPIRRVRALVDALLEALSPELTAMHSSWAAYWCRPST
ncbi:MAG: hypothetical protein HS107_12860 [Thermoflexaceae bacterium]|nr:hypothetical protein [Thermoflexaceae bacterium]